MDRIYTSPMGRAIETMKYTANLLKMNYGIEYWTKELWPELKIEEVTGPYANKMAIDIPGEVFRGEKDMPTHINWYLNQEIRDRNFDKVYHDIITNSDAFLARHGYRRDGGRYRCESPSNEQIAVFCHGGFGLTWLAHLLELLLTLVWSGFWLAPASVTTILLDQRSENWATPRCIGLGDVSHLYAEGLPVKPRGIVANFF